MKSTNRGIEDWNRLCREGLSYDGLTNVEFDFPMMTRRFGKAFIEYLEAAWIAKDNMSDSEFCRINGGIPDSFLGRLKKLKT